MIYSYLSYRDLVGRLNRIVLMSVYQLRRNKSLTSFFENSVVVCLLCFVYPSCGHENSAQQMSTVMRVPICVLGTSGKRITKLFQYFFIRWKWKC